MAYSRETAKRLHEETIAKRNNSACGKCNKCRLIVGDVKLSWGYEQFGYYGCMYRPCWCTPISNIEQCPKEYSDGSLSSMCKVNTEV